MLLNESFWQAVRIALAYVGNVATMLTRQYILSGLAIDSDILRAHSKMDADGLYMIACQDFQKQQGITIVRRKTLLLHSIYGFDWTG